MKRIVVVGTTGSGKTTLARRLAAWLSAPHIELDAIHWQPNWEQAPLEILRQQVAEAVSADSWVVDGNYGKVRDLIWPRADTLIWLDYPLYTIFWRLFWRTIQRAWTREDLWETGNQEKLWKHFLTRESLFLWALSSRPRHRRDYPKLIRQPEHAHLSVVRFHSPRMTEQWLAALASQKQAEVA